MKAFVVMVLAGWMAWIDTTRWEEARYRGEEDNQTVQVSSMTSSDVDHSPQPEMQKENSAPSVQTVLFGPRARSWRDLREESIR